MLRTTFAFINRLSQETTKPEQAYMAMRNLLLTNIKLSKGPGHCRQSMRCSSSASQNPNRGLARQPRGREVPEGDRDQGGLENQG